MVQNTIASLGQIKCGEPEVLWLLEMGLITFD